MLVCAQCWQFNKRMFVYASLCCLLVCVCMCVFIVCLCLPPGPERVEPDGREAARGGDPQAAALRRV